MGVNYTEIEAEKLDFVVVADVAELPNGERLFIEIDEYSLIVFNIAGKYFAIADVCTHDDSPLGEGEMAEQFEIACPRHGARFDVRNGKALSMPATVNISAFPVRVVEDQVEVGIPAD